MLKIALPILVLFFATTLSAKKSIAYYVSKAPFTMPKVQQPVFASKTFDVKNFGAVADGKTLNTKAFNKAIDECNKSGGGIVLVPEGIWLTAPIEIKSNVNLHLNKGAVIQFTKDHAEYPIIKAGKC